MKTVETTELSNTSNGGAAAIETTIPYTVTVTVEGASDLLFHRWNVEAVEAKSRAAKGSKAKKTDDIESYVYRMTDGGELALPGEWLRQAIILAAKYWQDPRSPRKSAMDLYKAGIVALTLHAPLGKPTWDYLDKRRVMVQRAGVNRTRPAIRAGWQATFEMMVLLPEYINPNTLREVIEQAGRIVGIGDFRPTFGRFGIVHYEVIQTDDSVAA